MGRMTPEMAITRTNYFSDPRRGEHAAIPYAALGGSAKLLDLDRHARLADVIKPLAWANP
jgi:hypothetical protein